MVLWVLQCLSGSCLSRSRPGWTKYKLEVSHLCVFQSVLSWLQSTSKMLPILKFILTGSIFEAWKTVEICYSDSSIQEWDVKKWPFYRNIWERTIKTLKIWFGRDIFLIQKWVAFLALAVVLCSWQLNYFGLYPNLWTQSWSSNLLFS